MRCWDFSRYALSSCAAFVLLAGCSGSQPPIGAPSAIRQSRVSDGYKTLYSFGAAPDGQQPKAGLIDVNGTLYGTTYGGGKYLFGTAYSFTLDGNETTIHSFGYGSDGANPSASLIAVNGLLYGTTESGGEAQLGTVFKIATNGTERVLHAFYGYYYHEKYYYDGARPVASLIYLKGRLYGTTSRGGIDNECDAGCGALFRVSTTGKEQMLHGFTLYDDGAIPLGALININGTLYGTTESGGGNSNYGGGTVFSTTKTGTERSLYIFNPSHSNYYFPDGAAPLAGLSKVNDKLYGTAGYGGGPYGAGAAFMITTGGEFTLLHSFGAPGDGNRPAASLLDVRGALYGTTELGGAYGRGTVFRITRNGNEKVLHSFGNLSDGAIPLAALINVNGTLYGTTSAGGTYGNGTVFAITLPSGN